MSTAERMPEIPGTKDAAAAGTSVTEIEVSAEPGFTPITEGIRPKWYYAAILVSASGLVWLYSVIYRFFVNILLRVLPGSAEVSADKFKTMDFLARITSPEFVISTLSQYAKEKVAALENLEVASRSIFRLALADALPADNWIRRELLHRYEQTEGKSFSIAIDKTKPTRVSIIMGHPRPFAASPSAPPAGLIQESETRPPLLHQFANIYIESLIKAAAPEAMPLLKSADFTAAAKMLATKMTDKQNDSAGTDDAVESTPTTTTGVSEDLIATPSTVTSERSVSEETGSPQTTSAPAQKTGITEEVTEETEWTGKLDIEILDIRAGSRPAGLPDHWTLADVNGVRIRCRHAHVSALEDEDSSKKYLLAKQGLTRDQQAVCDALKYSRVLAVFYPVYWYEAPAVLKAMMDTCVQTMFFRMNPQDSVMLKVLRLVAMVVPPEFMLRYATHGLLRDRNAFVVRASGGKSFGAPRSHALELVLAYCGMHVHTPIEPFATCAPTFQQPDGFPLYCKKMEVAGRQAAAVVLNQ